MSQTEFDEEDVTLRRVLESSENDDPDLQRALQISADVSVTITRVIHTDCAYSRVLVFVGISLID
ncbi:unnamed protein product [Trichobilharzia regenti]|nr:unnamed protein product [Trichobilharzia regenti]